MRGLGTQEQRSPPRPTLPHSQCMISKFQFHVTFKWKELKHLEATWFKLLLGFYHFFHSLTDGILLLFWPLVLTYSDAFSSVFRGIAFFFTFVLHWLKSYSVR